MRVPYNHLIKNLNIHYQKVKNTKFDEFFRCMAYLGFNCIKKSKFKIIKGLLHPLVAKI